MDSENMDTYASVMKAVSQRLFMVIASANNYEVMVGDITNAYLYADTGVKVYTRVGPEFEAAGYKEFKNGSLAQIIRALYGLPSSGRQWHIHLSGTLRSIGFLLDMIPTSTCVQMGEVMVMTILVATLTTSLLSHTIQEG